jgi:cytochrome o ubiquinol oxidase subunit 2
MNRDKYFALFVRWSLCMAPLLGGCHRMPLLDPKGPIGETQRFLIIAAVALMLIVVTPVWLMAVWFSRRYKASNTAATYAPKWSESAKIELVVWLVPIAIIMALGYLTWTETHRLDPYAPIRAEASPIHIEAISMDWKWLFIYPDQDIAVINELAFPVDVPLSFRLTSDTVMTSFFIPRLGSQIYAMAGMETRLHLLADEPGVYAGQNQQYSGSGYSYMRFQAIATSQEEFEAWVQHAKRASDELDLRQYERLARPGLGHPVTYFSSVAPDLFDDVIRKFNPSWKGMSDP